MVCEIFGRGVSHARGQEVPKPCLGLPFLDFVPALVMRSCLTWSHDAFGLLNTRKTTLQYQQKGTEGDARKAEL